MMTTAGDVVNADGSKNTDVFATGAGQVDPARMVDPGLVYDATEEDYWKFIQGTGIDLGCRRTQHPAAGHERVRPSPSATWPGRSRSPAR